MFLKIAKAPLEAQRKKISICCLKSKLQREHLLWSSWKLIRREKTQKSAKRKNMELNPRHCNEIKNRLNKRHFSELNQIKGLEMPLIKIPKVTFWTWFSEAIIFCLQFPFLNKTPRSCAYVLISAHLFTYPLHMPAMVCSDEVTFLFRQIML